MFRSQFFFALLQRPNNHSLTSAFCVGFNEKFRLGRWFSMCDCFHFKEWNPRGGWIASVNPIRINRLWILLNLIYTLTQTHTFYAYYSLCGIILYALVCAWERKTGVREQKLFPQTYTRKYISFHWPCLHCNELYRVCVTIINAELIYCRFRHSHLHKHTHTHHIRILCVHYGRVEK